MPSCKSHAEFRNKTGFITEAVLFLIRMYRLLVSPFLGSCCRFYPSCSAYAEQALRSRGLAAGAWLAVCRIFKCQPFHPGGIDVLETRA